MIFETTSIGDLAQLLAPHMGKPAWPGLCDARIKAQAQSFARRLGLWQRIEIELQTGAPIPSLKRSDFRDFQRTGNRARGEALIRQNAAQTDLAALALWLEHPAADLDYLQDLLWAWCEADWRLPAHAAQHIDLASSHRARDFAEYLWIFEGRIEAEVAARVGQEIERKALDIAADWRRPDLWETCQNNWNTVCNANLIQTAFYRIKNTEQLASFIHPLFRRMDYALAYYTDDGGCVEGTGYWEYGFGCFVDAALTLLHRTGGALNVMQDEKIQRICRYPLAAFLKPPLRAAFADGGNGFLGAETALKINRFYDIPELYSLVQPGADGLLNVQTLRGLALFDEQRADARFEPRDAFLPDLGYAKMHAGDCIVAALAGSNDVSHNHNDIGSFLLLRGDELLLTDPGAPIYSAKTFSARRYELLFCRSRGHFVPLINGFEQADGAEFRGSISAAGLQADGRKSISIDMSRAYPDPTLLELIRHLVVEPSGAVQLTDRYLFSAPPQALEEAFVTFETVEIQPQGVLIRAGNAATLLTTEADGIFAVQEFSPEEHEGRDPRPLRRVTFLQRGWRLR